MIKKIVKTAKGLVIILTALIITYSCSDLFNNPLKDKDTGDDVTLLLIDNNFFETTFTFHFIDDVTGEAVTDKDITVFLDGADAQNIVDLNGKKSTEFKPNDGEMQLAYDPNYSISATDPFEITVYVAVADRSYIVFPTEVYLNEGGEIDIQIEMSNVLNLKSAKLTPGSEPFDVKFNNVIIDQSSTEWGYAPYPKTLNGKNYFANYYPISDGLTGSLTADNFTGDTQITENWGTEGYVRNQSYALGKEHALQIGNIMDALFTNLYSATKLSGLTSCTEGLTFSVTEANGNAGTATFGYQITFSDGTTKQGLISSAQFPFTKNTGLLHFPANATTAVVNVFGDGQYDLTPSVTTLTNVCGQTIDIKATPHTSLKAYQIIATLICPGSPAGVTPTINGKFKIKNSNDPWTSFRFTRGKCTLLLKPGETYTIVGTLANDTETFDLPTDPTKIQAVVQQAIIDNESLENLTFSFNQLSSRVTQINVNVLFKDGSCPY